MSTPTDQQSMEKIVNLCKRRGFIFQASEIYGGLNGAWDYGPLGVELKRNLKNYWWRVTVHEREDVVGMDGAILTHPDVLRASGHVEGFSDPMVDHARRTCGSISSSTKRECSSVQIAVVKISPKRVSSI